MKKPIILLLCQLLMFQLWGRGPTVFTADGKMQRIASMSILEDKSGKLNFEEVLRSDRFEKSEKDIPNLQVSASTFWIRFEIKNESRFRSLVLMLEAPTIDEVVLYKVSDSGEVVSDVMGENLPFSQRTYNDPNYIFNLKISRGHSETYYLKVRSTEQMMIPLSVGTRRQVHEFIADNNIIFGLYAGFILVMFFYNLFVYFIVRDNSYLYYIAYLLLIGLTQISLKGFTFKYLWPDNFWLTDHSVVLLSALAAIAGMLFLRSFLQTKKHTPKLDRGLDVINAVFVISIILSMMDMGETSFKIMQLDTMICSFFGLFVAYHIARKGYRPAKFFLLAWTILLGGAIIFVLKDFGAIPFNRYTDHTLQIASTLETILLSLALADRINIFKKEKEEAQARELHERRDKQDILERQAEVLQTKVNEATQELRQNNIVLNDTNEQLQKTLVQLKATQAELVQKQKMASLGQLAAGVAHEVNNPLNIINVSLDILERDFAELKNYIDQFQAIDTTGENTAEKLAKAQAHLNKDAEYEEISKEVDKAMERARRGVSRTADIAQELRTFSKIDTVGMNNTRINKDIDAMLEMMKYTLGDIRVEKHFGQLPDIYCHSQKLNHLYQNLITNAVESIKKKGLPATDGKISIETIQENGNIQISITDNGTGMTEDVKEKAFDPFFTTKGVDGKGLGLSNAYGTMEEHGGKIEIETTYGVGTTLKLTLPIQSTKT